MVNVLGYPSVYILSVIYENLLLFINALEAVYRHFSMDFEDFIPSINTVRCVSSSAMVGESGR